MRLIMVVVLVIFVIMASLVITKDIIARAAISRTVRHLTGLGLSMQKIKLDIPKTSIDITGLKIYNPEGYPDKIMADLPVIYVDYNLGALIKGKVVLPELRLHLKEFSIIRDSEGKLNIDSIKVIREQKGKVIKEETEGKTPPVHIASLRLKIGRVVYKDYSYGAPPQVKVFNIDLDEQYRDITDLRALVNIIMVKTLRKTAINQLINFDLSIITERLPLGLKESTDVVTKSVAKVKKVAEESVEKAAEVITETTKALKGVFQLPPAGEEKD